MKKTKKLFATVLSSALATTMLSACSSGNTENNQSTKEPTATVAPTTNVKPTESAPTDEAGKDATQEPATTVAETEEVTTVEETSANESIIPLFKSEYTIDDIKKISPEELQTFDTFCKYYPVEILDQKDDGFVICKLAYGDRFKLIDLSGEIYDIENLICGKPGGALHSGLATTVSRDIMYEYYDSSKGYGLIPLFYNSNYCCLVGYMYKDELEGNSHFHGNGISTYNNTEYCLVEVIYDPPYYLYYLPADAAKYGM